MGKIYDYSLSSYVKNKYWYIKTKIKIPFEFIPALNDLYNRKKEIGTIYGEFNPHYDDITLCNVSHVLDYIPDIKYILKKHRKLKIKNISNQTIDEYIKIKFKLRILNTNSGKIISELLNNNIKLKTTLYYNEYSKKIYTINIETQD